MNRDSLNALTQADWSQMQKQLGIKELRPGKDGYSNDPLIGANYDQMIANPYLNYPDPLVTNDGRQVKNAKMWYKVRRPELIEAFEENIYGRIPENVPGVTWKVVKEEKTKLGEVDCITRTLAGVVDNSAYPSIKVEIQAEIVYPEQNKGNMPVIVEFGMMMGNMRMPAMPAMGGPARPQRVSWKQQVVERGWAACTLVPTSYQADGGHGLRQGIIGLTNKGEYRKPDDWGSLRAWGWGASRLLDYFETEKLFDATKVAVEGNSRYGKTALVTAVFDERIASAFVSSSGKGGATPWRRYCGETVENLAASSEYHWMCGNFLKYASDPYSAADMPVDQHELIAICAPRPILISSGTYDADRWQDLIGMHMSTVMASPVYELVCGNGLRYGYAYGTSASAAKALVANGQVDPVGANARVEAHAGVAGSGVITGNQGAAAAGPGPMGGAYDGNPATVAYGQTAAKAPMLLTAYPGTNVPLMGGRLAFRQHDGGHEPGPNWPYFLDFFEKYVVKGEK